MFYGYCFENREAESTVLTLGNNYRNKNFGFSRVPNKTCYRDYLPTAARAFLAGDFNKWNEESHALMPIGGGFF